MFLKKQQGSMEIIALPLLLFMLGPIAAALGLASTYRRNVRQQV
jgi:hypothetical protein